jgi:1,4-alpha-glucan branching enzyme
MYDSAQGGTCFWLKPGARAKRVELAGSFSAWQPTAMRRQRDGCFTTVVPLRHGTYEYKFIVDGDWCTDPDNPLAVPNPYGTENSLALVARMPGGKA